MKIKRHVHWLQSDLLTENTWVWQPAAEWLVLWILQLEKHRPMGSSGLAKGSLYVCVCVLTLTHACSEGRTVCWAGEHLASETTKASPQLSRTAGADRHCVAKLHKGSSLWRGEEKGLTFLNLFVRHQETVITLVVQSRQKKLTSKAT